MTLKVVYDHVGKCRELALCYFIQINFILFDHHAFGNRKFQAKSHVTNPLQTCYRVSRKIVTEIASHFKICATEYRKCHFSGLKLNIFIAIYCKLPIWICTKTNTRTDTRDTWLWHTSFTVTRSQSQNVGIFDVCVPLVNPPVSTDFGSESWNGQIYALH